MSPDPRNRRKPSKPKAPSPVVRTRPSPDDEHEIVYFRRHKSDDQNESTPGREALDSYPVGVRAKMRAALVAVATAPPKRFAGGGYWKSLLVVVDGRDKPFRTVLSETDYAEVRALGDE